MPLKGTVYWAVFGVPITYLTEIWVLFPDIIHTHPPIGHEVSAASHTLMILKNATHLYHLRCWEPESCLCCQNVSVFKLHFDKKSE